MKRREGRNIRSGALAGVCALCLILTAIVAASVRETAAAAPVIVTDQGPLRGLTASGENQYLGIPYAAPPLGSLRWMPPQPAADFNGVFQATKFGRICTQLNRGMVVGGEDCLTLNVYVPDVEPSGDGFPVMVWIHGGGLVTGAGSFYDPTRLVVKGNVIVVTINYRLGLLGFFAHPAIDAEGHLNANYGLMDQQFALDWVRRNIGAFGGDHKRVTIFGESAGGFSVLSNLASPTAEGLFRRAIVESGAYAHFQHYFDLNSVVPLTTAETDGTLFVPAGTALAAKVGCTTSQAGQCLRATTASALVSGEPGGLFPIIDGTVLTQNLDSAFASGEFNRVPVISGTNHDEWRYFVALNNDLAGHPLTDAVYPTVAARLLRNLLGPVSDSFIQLVLSEYPLSDYTNPQSPFQRAPLAQGAIGTDLYFVCTARNAALSLSKYVRTYTYEFHDETAPSFFPPLSFPLGDAHFIEVQYLFNFGGITPTFTSDQQQLSDAMIGYWAQFAKTGNPNVEGEPNWPRYSGERRRFLSLVAPTPATESDSSFDADHKCSSFWDTF
jgi:para-nitrobenzyl esterase